MVETREDNLLIHLPHPTPLFHLLHVNPRDSVLLPLLKPLSPEFLAPAAILTLSFKTKDSENSRRNVLNASEKLNNVVKNKLDGKPNV
jgi:hypothetical protein